MKVKIKEKDGISLTIPLPLSLIANRLTIGLLKKHLPNSVPVSSQDILRLAHCLRECKRQFGRLILVEVESEDGDRVKIQL